METLSVLGSNTRWYEKYLPFVAKSPEMQAQWLAAELSRMLSSDLERLRGVLSREEIRPYVRLFLDGCDAVRGGWGGEEGVDDVVVRLFEAVGEENLRLMVECADIYDIPRLFRFLRNPSVELAIMAMKKIPPPYEKNPLLIIDRVFQAIREKSGKLLEDAAAGVAVHDDAPADFVGNYERFKEIMMDEHVLSMLYPKAK